MSITPVRRTDQIHNESQQEVSCQQRSFIGKTAQVAYHIFHTLISTVMCSLYVLSSGLFTWLNPESVPSNDIDRTEFIPETNSWPWKPSIEKTRKIMGKTSLPLPEGYWEARINYIHCLDATYEKVLPIKKLSSLLNPIKSVSIIKAAIAWANAEDTLFQNLDEDIQRQLTQFLEQVIPQAIQWIQWETPENAEELVPISEQETAMLEQQAEILKPLMRTILERIKPNIWERLEQAIVSGDLVIQISEYQLLERYNLNTLNQVPPEILEQMQANLIPEFLQELHQEFSNLLLPQISKHFIRQKFQKEIVEPIEQLQSETIEQLVLDTIKQLQPEIDKLLREKQLQNEFLNYINNRNFKNLITMAAGKIKSLQINSEEYEKIRKDLMQILGLTQQDFI